MVRDLRRNVRIAFIDTHWFLQERSSAQQVQFFERLMKALNGARDREVILVAHHPYYSAGPHGAIIPGYHTLGIAYVLKQAGALVQDLNSPPYDALLAGFRTTFEASHKPPLIYAGGHDHSFQVLTGADEADPRFVLVSGAGSKVSSLQMGPGLVWGEAEPGYMMLVFRKDDGVDLFVMAGDKQFRECVGTDAEAAACMAEGGERVQDRVFRLVARALQGAPRAHPGVTRHDGSGHALVDRAGRGVPAAIAAAAGTRRDRVRSAGGSARRAARRRRFGYRDAGPDLSRPASSGGSSPAISTGTSGASRSGFRW